MVTYYYYVNSILSAWTASTFSFLCPPFPRSVFWWKRSINVDRCNNVRWEEDKKCVIKYDIQNPNMCIIALTWPVCPAVGVAFGGWGKKYKKHWFGLKVLLQSYHIYLSLQVLILSNQYWAIACFLLRFGGEKPKNFSCVLYVVSQSSETWLINAREMIYWGVYCFRLKLILMNRTSVKNLETLLYM